MKNSVLSVLGIVLLVTGVVINFSTNSEKKLQEIITTYQDHESYDGEEYPLGLFTKDYYESEANFATDLLNRLENINLDDLNKNDLISYELLKFELKDIIDYFYFERYLNPLLSDSGFHSSLNYMVRPLSSYKKTLEYLNKLNSLPDFVDQNLINIRAGLEKGVSQPLVIFDGYESTYNDHITKNYLDIKKSENTSNYDIRYYVTNNKKVYSKYKWRVKKKIKMIIKETFFALKKNKKQLLKIL